MTEIQAEFNWYIVVQDENLSGFSLSAFNCDGISTGQIYLVNKPDYRIYPMDTPLPLIYNEKCLAIATVTQMTWDCNETLLKVAPILVFPEDDPAALYYESAFKDYKQEQETIDDGGKIDLRNVVNPLMRKRF